MIFLKQKNMLKSEKKAAILVGEAAVKAARDLAKASQGKEKAQAALTLEQAQRNLDIIKGTQIDG